MAALRPARRLVREHTHALKFIRRHIVGHGLESAGIIDRRQAVAAVAAAVEIGFVLHRLDRAVVFDAGFGKHLDRVSATMDVKGFLAVERDLDRPAGDHRKFCSADLVRKPIALAAEAAAHRSGDNAATAGGQSGRAWWWE